jgi:NAD(P)H-hydrate epimerase
MAGSYGKMGAAILASRACLKSGVGLLTSHVPRLGYVIIQSSVPEAMASVDRSDILISEHPCLDTYTAIGVGPGLGDKPNTQIALKELLLQVGSKPLVLDADAINILAANKQYLNILPQQCILTPHPGEIDRLLGPSRDGYERLSKAVEFAKTHKVIIVLKGAYTAVINSNGECHFNSSGNPGMATAGSGDVLTGIILAFLAQSYSHFDAVRVAVYLHGLAADLYVEKSSMESLSANSIIKYLGKAFRSVHA